MKNIAAGRIEQIIDEAIGLPDDNIMAELHAEIETLNPQR